MSSMFLLDLLIYRTGTALFVVVINRLLPELTAAAPCYYAVEWALLLRRAATPCCCALLRRRAAAPCCCTVECAVLLRRGVRPAVAP